MDIFDLIPERILNFYFPLYCISDFNFEILVKFWKVSKCEGKEKKMALKKEIKQVKIIHKDHRQ